MLLYVGIWLGFAATPATCEARCPCTVPPGVDWHSAHAMVPRERSAADAIFLGRVIAIDTTRWRTLVWPPDGLGRSRVTRYPDVVRYTLAVSQRWKGQVARRVLVEVEAFGTTCGRTLDPDMTYLIYAGVARASDGTRAGFRIGSCSRVRRAEEIEADVRLLGRGEPPTR